ncbi:MAG: hypothetical protein ACE5OZ_26120 [Candidatus Heimdallarchaeota archaeon]
MLVTFGGELIFFNSLIALLIFTITFLIRILALVAFSKATKSVNALVNSLLPSMRNQVALLISPWTVAFAVVPFTASSQSVAFLSSSKISLAAFVSGAKTVILEPLANSTRKCMKIYQT